MANVNDTQILLDDLPQIRKLQRECPDLKGLSIWEQGNSQRILKRPEVFAMIEIIIDWVNLGN